MTMATDFTRPSISPLVTLGSAGGWEETDIAATDAFYDTPNSRWVIHYDGYSVTSGKWSSGLAFASAITGPYTKSTHNPIFAPGVGDGYLTGDGSIVYKGGTYYFFFGNWSSNLTTIPPQVLLATASDLEGVWTRQNSGNPVLTLGSAGSIDAAGIADTCVKLMPDGVTFECIYTATADNASPGQRVVGRATSTDGITWTKQGTFVPRVPGWLGNYYGAPNLLRDPTDSSKVAFFCDEAITGTTNGARHIGRAWSADGGAHWSWRHDALAPSLNTWETVQVFDPSPVLYQGKVYLFYAGASVASVDQGMGSQIGYAVADYYPGAA